MAMREAAEFARRMPAGAEPAPGGGTHFRVWAPRRKSVEVVLETGAFALAPEAGGYFSGMAREARPGALYRFRLDGRAALYPDPASRFQPDGPHGPSEVIDPGAFTWTDAGWPGLALEGQVIYEMHVGTFTREGTWAAAAEQIPELASLGVTAIELMPVAEFAGSFGWGYDGVDLFAPTRLYGRPDDLRRFVDRAHAAGIGVVLDVVYNHFGPDGNYLSEFAGQYFKSGQANEWGEQINFDGPDSAPVREFFTANAAYWISEFHMDGLRLDATQAIADSSETHILTEIGRAARRGAGGRSILLIAENEPQHTRLVRQFDQGGYGLDMLWNDDFHHSAMVALTGRREAYYSDYRGTPQELLSALRHGYLFQGQVYAWQGKRRGQPSVGVPPAAFVLYTQNHDQIANTARGHRLHLLTSPGRLKAMTALMLLAPGTPMLFQGQEFAAATPFLYFADHKPELMRAIYRGRADFLRQFPSLRAPDMDGVLVPDQHKAFESSILDFADRVRNAHIYALHRDLLRLRREDPAIRLQHAGALDGAVVGAEALVLRWFGEKGDDRLLLVNFGADLDLTPAPEPLLAPPHEKRWAKVLGTDDEVYGGLGTPPVERGAGWVLPAHAAVLLKPVDPPLGILERERRLEEETIALRKREKDENA